MTDNTLTPLDHIKITPLARGLCVNCNIDYSNYEINRIFERR